MVTDQHYMARRQFSLFANGKLLAKYAQRDRVIYGS